MVIWFSMQDRLFPAHLSSHAWQGAQHLSLGAQHPRSFFGK